VRGAIRPPFRVGKIKIGGRQTLQARFPLPTLGLAIPESFDPPARLIKAARHTPPARRQEGRPAAGTVTQPSA